MKRFSVISAAVLGLALAAGNAHATKPGNNGGGNGGCGQGQQTNGCGGSTPGNTYNQGGTGGTAYGGHGGTGVGVGIGQGGQGGKGGEGGSVWGSGNSSNANSNKQGQAQSSRNDNRSSASNSGNNAAQTVTVNGDSYDAPRIPVATAYAPNIAPTAVCMGSTSAGGQGMTFGVSFGTSWTDDNCMLLEQVRTVATVIGDRDTASEMMCDVPAYKAARERVGKPCGGAQVVASAPAPTPVADTHQPKYTAQAPIVVSPVVPRIERFRITTDGLHAVN